MRGTSVVAAITDALRAEAMARSVGDFLGSENDLVRQMKVSRPTLRQAATLVCQENLLTVRRGVGGGYFVARPDSHAVSRAAAVYLRARRTTVANVFEALPPIRCELARLAAQCDDPLLRSALAAFIEAEAAIDPERFRYRDFLLREREFAALLGAMSNNRVIALFLEILYDFSAMLGRNEDLYINRPDRIAMYRTKRNRLAQAIFNGDPEMAVVAARRCAMTAGDWLGPADHGGSDPAIIDFIDFPGAAPVLVTGPAGTPASGH